MITVQGYLDGVAYTALIDPDATPDAEHGIITHCSPPSARTFAAIEATVGTSHRFTPTSEAVPVDLTTPLGVLAGLHATTEVVTVAGDLPDGYPSTADTDPGVVY